MNKRRKSFVLNERRPFLNIDEEIHGQRTLWRERKAYINGLLKEPDRLANEDPKFGIYALFHVVAAGRRLYRRYLLSRFGYKAPSMDFDYIYGSGLFKPERFVRPERLPTSAGEAEYFTQALLEWAAWESAFVSIHQAAKEASGPNKDTFQAMRKRCLERHLHVPNELQVKWLLRKSYEDKHIDDVVGEERAITWLSGWVGAPLINPQRIPLRLERSLKEEHNNAPDRLLQELPATTLIECDDLVQAGEEPLLLRRRVVRHLEKAGSTSVNQKPGKIVTGDYLSDMEQRGEQSAKSKKRGKLEASDLPYATSDELILEEFFAKEYLEAAKASGTISEGEYQALERTRRGDLDREIADDLNVTEGTVKKQKSRGREKLRKAEGR